MARIKLTKSAVDAAKPQAQAVELRDTVVPGFLCKITPAGRKVFMLQYRTNAGERRKPALGQYGELTVEQARVMAQEWLAEVRRGGDPSAAKNAARKAPTMKEYCHTFMEDYSKQRNKPSTQRGYQGVIDRNIIPILGRMKVQDVKRPDVAALMKKLAYKPAEANRTFGVLRKMFTRVGKETVTVQITSVVRASDTSFNVRWTERRYVNGAAAGLERWTAVVSIVLQTPRTEERLRRNPLGIYVNGLSWSRELDSSDGAKP